MASYKFIASTLLAALTLFSAGIAAAQTMPAAPTRLCIDTDCPPDASSSAAIKWHPGHYMQVRRDDPDTIQATRFKYYDQIASNANIEGVGVFFRWSQLEGPTRGDYKSGLALVRAEIDKLKGLPAPKRIAIRIMEQYYGGELANSSKFFPAYLTQAGKLVQTDSRVTWKRWDPEAMGWFIDMTNAYAAAFNDDPYVEIISPFHETAIGWGSTPKTSDYSETALDTQMRRLASALKKAWTKTNVWIPTNWGLNGSRMEGYISYLSSIGVGAGNPDVCPSCNMDLDLILRGAIGGVDYRGQIPNMFSVECSELGYDSVGPVGGFTATEIYSYMNETQRGHYLFWDRNVVVGTAEQRWETGILPVINSKPLKSVACPSSYEACNSK